MKKIRTVDEALAEVRVKGAVSFYRAVFRCLLIAGATNLTVLFLGCFGSGENSGVFLGPFDSGDRLTLAVNEVGLSLGSMLFLIVAVFSFARRHKDRDLCVFGAVEILLFIAAVILVPTYPHFR